MFEWIKVAAELVAKLVDPKAIAEARSAGKLGTIGADLFGLYGDLNMVYVSGVRLVSYLEQYLQWVERKRLEESRHTDWVPSDFREAIDNQIVALKLAVGSLTRLRPWITVVDPDAATSLVILTGSKTGALVALVRALDRGLPTSGDLPGDTLEYRGHRHPIVHFDQVVEWNTNWGLDNASVIANYLESRQPQKELDALRDALDALRAGLAKYFRLDDVLLAVGDERLNTYAWYLPGVRPGAK